MFFTLTMSCLIVFIYLKRRISISAVLVSEFLLIVLVLNIPSVRKSQSACTRPTHRYRYPKMTLSKTLSFHANLGERYF